MRVERHKYKETFTANDSLELLELIEKHGVKKLMEEIMHQCKVKHECMDIHMSIWKLHYIQLKSWMVNLY